MAQEERIEINQSSFGRDNVKTKRDEINKKQKEMKSCAQVPLRNAAVSRRNSGACTTGGSTKTPGNKRAEKKGRRKSKDKHPRGAPRRAGRGAKKKGLEREEERRGEERQRRAGKRVGRGEEMQPEKARRTGAFLTAPWPLTTIDDEE
ncbi:hypothetical protein KM043_004545 [Ampulex compressa]|nr:hypothetical protein KM043_004545 [Ampulex compressa]